MEPIVKLKNINLIYQSLANETHAIDNLSLSVNKGEFVSIVGPSGCGKSTLLSIIAGLLKPTSGQVIIEKNCKIGYMLQKDFLFEWRTILNNALLGPEIEDCLSSNKKAYVIDLLSKYGLKEFINNKPSQLSGGMRQRVALIRTLATNPDILLLDEPFSALDYQTRLYVCDEISSIIKKEKKTAILVTHDIGEAISVSDRIFVLSKRPATLKSIYEIKMDIENKTPLKTRESAEFNYYFNNIWKELDVYGK